MNTLVVLFLCVASAIAQEVTGLQPMQVNSHPSQEVVVELLISGSGLADASPRFFGLGSKVRVSSRTDTEITGRLTLSPKKKGTFFLAISKNGKEAVTSFSLQALEPQESKVSSLTLPPCGPSGPQGVVCQGSEPWWDGLETVILWPLTAVLAWVVVYLLQEWRVKVVTRTVVKRVKTKVRKTQTPKAQKPLKPVATPEPEKPTDTIPFWLKKPRDNNTEPVVVPPLGRGLVTVPEHVLRAAKSDWKAGRVFNEGQLLKALAEEPDLLKEWQAFKAKNPKPPTPTEARQPANIAGN